MPVIFGPVCTRVTNVDLMDFPRDILKGEDPEKEEKQFKSEMNARLVFIEDLMEEFLDMYEAGEKHHLNMLDMYENFYWFKWKFLERCVRMGFDSKSLFEWIDDCTKEDMSEKTKENIEEKKAQREGARKKSKEHVSEKTENP